MGLDTSHDCWHGAYSSFAAWRLAIAKAGGYGTVKTADGREHADIPYEDFSMEVFDGDWDELPADPLIVLLAHSDCDGEIPAWLCEPLRERLIEIADKVEPDWQWATATFIAGLQRAIEAGEAVDFH